jgi:hypothetical protein
MGSAPQVRPPAVRVYDTDGAVGDLGVGRRHGGRGHRAGQGQEGQRDGNAETAKTTRQDQGRKVCTGSLLSRDDPLCAADAVPATQTNHRLYTHPGRAPELRSVRVAGQLGGAEPAAELQDVVRRWPLKRLGGWRAANAHSAHFSAFGGCQRIRRIRCSARGCACRRTCGRAVQIGPSSSHHGPPGAYRG